MSSHDYRSAHRRTRSPTDRYHSKRQRSPFQNHDRPSSKRSKPALLISLPFKALPLSKGQYDLYKPMFGLYLDIQKRKVLEELPEDEVRGRWKSFMGKWYGCCFVTY